MKKKYLAWSRTVGILILLLLTCITAGLCIGEIHFSPTEVFRLLWESGDRVETQILQHIRLPRVMLGLFAGGALSLSGVILQGIFRNPLVEPYTLGISGGASVGIALAIVFSLQGLLGGFVLPLAGFIGALATILMVYLFGIRKNQIRIQTLLLTGVMISFISSSLMMLIMALTKSENLHGIVFWMMGSLNETNTGLIVLMGIVSLLTLFFTYLYTPALNALRLGNEEATQLGINTGKSIRILFLLSSLLTGICVSITGVIGFVGLIIPQMMRYWVGSDFRILLITSFLGGASFLILSDIFSRTILSPNELPIGVITGIIGGILFMLIMGSSKTGKEVNK